MAENISFSQLFYKKQNIIEHIATAKFENAIHHPQMHFVASKMHFVGKCTKQKISKI